MKEIPNQDRHPSCSASRFRRAARCVSQIYDHHLEPYGLTITQYGLLGHLQRYNGINIGALADKLVMDPTTLTRNLRPLEKQGLIVLAQDEKDRRSRKLSLTKDGMKKFKAARPGWDAAQEKIATILGPDDSIALATTIDRMIDKIRT